MLRPLTTALLVFGTVFVAVLVAISMFGCTPTRRPRTVTHQSYVGTGAITDTNGNPVRLPYESP